MEVMKKMRSAGYSDGHRKSLGRYFYYPRYYRVDGKIVHWGLHMEMDYEFKDSLSFEFYSRDTMHALRFNQAYAAWLQEEFGDPSYKTWQVTNNSSIEHISFSFGSSRKLFKAKQMMPKLFLLTKLAE